MKKCSCAQFPKSIAGRHHSRYCDMWKTSYLFIAQDLNFPDDAWFFVVIKQGGVILVKRRMIPQQLEDGSIYAYKLGIPITSYSRKYHKAGKMLFRQMSIIQDASDYFCSTVEILSDKDHVDDTFRATYIDDSLENSIFEKYRRSYTARFETDLYNDSEISDLAERLLDRFGEVRETLSIGFGVDTFQVDLLDTIEFEAVINGRTFSEYSEWIVKECDHGQDEVVMEGKEITYIMSIDDEIATIDDYTWVVSKDDYDGI